MRIAGFTKDSIVDGAGIRYTIYFQGCNHKCKGCHNPDTHRFDGGEEYSLDDIKSLIDKQRLITGITLSGGDPFFQCRSALEVSRYAHSKGKNVWCYTGYTIEEIMNSGNDGYKELLREVDILVDGRFEEKNKTLTLAFRGSSNQRLIDVKKTLELGYIVEKE